MFGLYHHRLLLHKSFPIVKSIPTVYIRFNHNHSNHDQNVTKESNQLDPKPQATLPQKVYKWGDPVPEKMFKKIRSEYYEVDQSQIGEETEWIPIYQMPKIKAVRTTVKMKISITFMSIIMCLTRLYDFLIDPNLISFTPVLMFGTTVGGLIMLGDYCRRLLVQIYVTDDNRYIRITRFTFFAKRLDMVLPVNSVLPLTENNVHKRKFMLKLETIPPKNTIEGFDRPEFYDEKFNITLKYGGVLDQVRFERALGSILRVKPGL